jgi:hypothetical protein
MPGATEADQRPALSGKGPFVVPPLSTKAPFYSLGVIRELWSDAAHALMAADRVFVIGYSVPLTDLASSAMLDVTDDPGKAWKVINRDADRVVNHLRQIGVGEDRIATQPSVAAWVDDYEAEHCREEFPAIRESVRISAADERAAAPIMIRRSRTDANVASAMAVTDGCICFDAHPIAGSLVPEEYPRARDLAAVIDAQGSPQHLRARITGVDGECTVIGPLDPELARGWNGILNWCAFEGSRCSSLAPVAPTEVTPQSVVARQRVLFTSGRSVSWRVQPRPLAAS